MRKFVERVKQFAEDRGAGTMPSAVKPPSHAVTDPSAPAWRFVGPDGGRNGETAPVGGRFPIINGRVTDIAVLANQAGERRVYVATANGGAWFSPDAGRTWQALMDGTNADPQSQRTDSLACGALHVEAGESVDQDTVFVATGEGNDRNGYNGIGVQRSVGGGPSGRWVGEEATPSLEGWSSFELAADPDRPGVLVLASTRGLYVRDPATQAWQRTMEGVFSSVVTLDHDGGATFYAAEWGGRVYRSDDGQAWSEVGNGHDELRQDTRLDRPGRVGLASGHGRVYALVADDHDASPVGVFLFDPAADAWRQLPDHPVDLFGTRSYQGDFDLAIATHPTDPAVLYLGGAAVTFAPSGEHGAALFRSTLVNERLDNQVIGASIHPDVHRLRPDPLDAHGLWVGCDGGIFSFQNASSENAAAVSHNAGLGCFLVNSIAQHPERPELLAVGSQDNGCLLRPADALWSVTLPGDCGAVVIHPKQPGLVLRSVFDADLRGGWVRWDGATDRNVFVFTADHAFPADRLSDGYDASPSRSRRWTSTDKDWTRFYAPLVGNTIDGESPGLVAFGTCRPWLSEDFGVSWYPITTGDVSLDHLGARISALAFGNADTLFAGTEAGRVFLFTRVRDRSWKVRRLDDDGDGLRANTAITDIVPVGDVGRTIFLTVGCADVMDHAWTWHGQAHGGGDWRSATGLPNGAGRLPRSHHACIAIDGASDDLFVGTDIGVWRSQDHGDSWSPFSKNLPEAAVLDLVVGADRKLLAACYGRGVFEVDLR